MALTVERRCILHAIISFYCSTLRIDLSVRYSPGFLCFALDNRSSRSIFEYSHFECAIALSLLRQKKKKTDVSAKEKIVFKCVQVDVCVCVCVEGDIV